MSLSEETPRTKGKYELVAGLAADEEEALAADNNEDPAISRTKNVACSPQHYDDDDNVPETSRQHFLYRCAVSDESYSFRGIRLVDGVETVRFLKFLIVTAVMIAFVHGFVRWMDLEHDPSYSLSDMVLYDGPTMMLDLMVFFVVGRLFKKQGVDHLAWCLTALCGALYTSWETTFTFLQHSVSLYEIHCLWPWKLWAYVLILIPLVSILIVKHVQYAVQVQHDGVVKLVELTLTLVLLLMPQLSNPNFHFHHWYAGWLLGMHANYDAWWSRATMAWCWGQYMNGIAVYGRDPTLTCAYAYYMSIDMRCPYMECYLEPPPEPGSNETSPPGVYQPLETPDWRNCSSTHNYSP